MAQFLFIPVFVDDVGVLQLTHKAGLDRVDVDPAELVPLFQFFVGELFGFGFPRKFVDPGDHFVHVHYVTSQAIIIFLIIPQHFGNEKKFFLCLVKECRIILAE